LFVVLLTGYVNTQKIICVPTKHDNATSEPMNDRSCRTMIVSTAVDASAATTTMPRSAQPR